jgi:hypothetical protein
MKMKINNLVSEALPSRRATHTARLLDWEVDELRVARHERRERIDLRVLARILLQVDDDARAAAERRATWVLGNRVRAIYSNEMLKKYKMKQKNGDCERWNGVLCVSRRHEQPKSKRKKHQ